jgi:hypothetical protein
MDGCSHGWGLALDQDEQTAFARAQVKIALTERPDPCVGKNSKKWKKSEKNCVASTAFMIT